MPKELQDYSVKDLKSLVYDQSDQILLLQANIQAMRKEIILRGQPIPEIHKSTNNRLKKVKNSGDTDG